MLFRSQDDSAWYYMRVYKTGGAPVCATYKLEVTNGVYGPPPSMTTKQFSYQGDTVQKFVVPAGVTEIEATILGASGGAGGFGCGNSSNSGSGGFVKGKFAVTPGQTIGIVVGRGGDNYFSCRADVTAFIRGGRDQPARFVEHEIHRRPAAEARSADLDAVGGQMNGGFWI